MLKQEKEHDWRGICDRQELIRCEDAQAMKIIAGVRGRRLHFYDAEFLGWWDS